MNKTVVAIIALIVLMIGGGTVYLLSNDEKETENSTTKSTNSDAKSEAAQTNQSAAAGKYEEYSESSLASASGTRLLFFHAPWCPQCRALDADIVARGVPAGVTILKVDYDSSQDLRQKYDVTLQTTIVEVDESGQLVDKYVAYDEPSLQSVIDNLL